MQHSQAVEMFSNNDWNHSEKQVWADLGCGTGTFTLALAHFLAPGSRIVAVDKDQNSLIKLPNQHNQVYIEKRTLNFFDIDFSPKKFDGILMANSLHYVQNQSGFIEKTKHFLKPGGCFLIVEYDMKSPNPWVPYPVNFERLKQLFPDAGFPTVKKINVTPSRFNPSNLFSAIILQQ